MSIPDQQLTEGDVLDVYDVPKNTIESLSKEANDGSILERFYSNRELQSEGGKE
jgi:hypothetical protein